MYNNHHMQIDFFEEFPKKALDKAKLIDFPCTIFIAAKNIKDFEKYKLKLTKINKNIKAAYWPVLKQSYWISPFSNHKELGNLEKELTTFKDKVLIDLELPFLNSKLFIKNLLYFFKNKKIINRIMKHKNIYTAEYPIFSKIIRWKLKLFGLHFKTNKRIVMFYTSIIKNNLVKNKIKKFIIKNKPIVGLGTITTGIFGTEPILTDKQLEQDLTFLKENQINHAVIFRLGGLNNEYLKVIKRYI